MNSIFKNRKFIIGLASALIVILTIGSIIFLKNKGLKEEVYTMYVKINPLVKLTYKVDYFKCKDDEGKDSICGGVDSEVLDFELINDDAKEIYNSLDFKGKYLYDVLVTLCDTARKNNIGFEKLEITTDDSNIKMDEVTKVVNEKTKYENTIDVYVEFKEYIKQEEIVKDEEISKYLVRFDTNGGNTIDNQIVSKNEKIEKPNDPQKEGYSFKEWQLDGKKFDFNTAINKDITLISIWEKNKEEVKPVENSTTPTPTPEPENKVKSTLNRINLNDNLLVMDWLSAGTYCNYYIFSDNVEEVIPSKYIKTVNGRKYIILYDEELNDYYQMPDNEIHYLEDLENAAVTSGNSLELPLGIIDFQVFNSNHHIGYSYSTLDFLEDYGSLTTEYNNLHNAFFDRLNNVFTSAYFVQGGCGSGYDQELLTESICEKYHLTCDRW